MTKVSPFATSRRIEIDATSIPSGWSNQEKRNGRKRVTRSVGRQSTVAPQLKTHERKDLPTAYDDEGELTQTANKWIVAVEPDGLTDEQIIDAMITEMADDLGKTVQAVETKVAFTVIGDWIDCKDYIAANKAEWGEE